MVEAEVCVARILEVVNHNILVHVFGHILRKLVEGPTEVPRCFTFISYFWLPVFEPEPKDGPSVSVVSIIENESFLGMNFLEHPLLEVFTVIFLSRFNCQKKLIDDSLKFPLHGSAESEDVVLA